jgi:hypothetical protein
VIDVVMMITHELWREKWIALRLPVLHTRAVKRGDPLSSQNRDSRIDVPQPRTDVVELFW